MADELVLSASLSYTRPNATAVETQSGSVGLMVVDLFADAGPDYVQGYLSALEDTPLAIPVGETTPGYVWIQNVGTDNSADVLSADDADPLVRLAPGQLAIFPCAPDVELFVSGIDGTATVRYFVVALV